MATQSAQMGKEDAEKLQFIEEITKNANAVQEKILAEILTQNAETEYLERFELGGATDRAAFKGKIPVVDYEDLRQDVDRIANGDRSAILCGKPISELLTSSGTSAGKKKLIPTIKEDIGRRILFRSLMMPILNLYVPDLNKGKGLNFIVARAESKTCGGLIVRPLFTSFYKSNMHILHRLEIGTSPAAAILCPDYFQSMYTQMLSGLCQRSLVFYVGSLFAPGILQSIHFLHQNWPQLVRDIESGMLSDKINDRSIRESISDILKPDHELADFVSNHCSSTDWSGIMRKIWPNAKFLHTVVTGTMSQYIPMLDFYSGGLPIVSMAYGCSEACFGINLHPMCNPLEISYTLLPNMAYFEFIPYGREHSTSPDKTKVVDLADVELGKEYELVITTHAGLYRYRVGDILRVTGFHNAAPQFRFMRRKGVALSIDADKTDETEIQKAVESASEILKPCGAVVSEYTSCVDVKSIPGHYVVYLELVLREGGEWPDGEVLESCCSAMEAELNFVYREIRTGGGIGPLEIRIVRNGTFGEVMDHAVSKGASINQYKVPRCTALQDVLHLLDSRVVSSHFSPVFLEGKTQQSI